MQIFTHKSRNVFEPAPAAVALDAVAVAYTTPAVWALKLSGLAHLQVLEGRLVYDLKLSGSATTGTALVKLKTGSTVLAIETVTLSNASELSGVLDVDLTGVNGAAPLVLEVEITAAADAGLTAVPNAALDLIGPLVVSGC